MKKDIFDNYADLIVDKFNLTREELFSKDRRGDIVIARYLLFYLCLERPMKTAYILNLLRKNGHKTAWSNIPYGHKKVEKLISEDFDFRQLTDDILNR